jgi:hypothetical protein
MGEEIDDLIIAIIKAGALKQAVEMRNEFCPLDWRKMFMIAGQKSFIHFPTLHRSGHFS